jgi:hypothetical protein
MSKPVSDTMSHSMIGRIDSLPIGEKWNVRFRLEELSILCECTEDGSLQIHIKHWLELILVCITLLRFTTSRRQQVEMLERCWHLTLDEQSRAQIAQMEL